MRKGKTAGPNEIQVVHLQSQPSILDPVKAFDRIMQMNPEKGRESLLFQTINGPFTKNSFIKCVEQVWGKALLEKWSDHLFRVGGASLRANLGTSEKSIKKVRRWKSESFRQYVKVFSEEETRTTKLFLDAIQLVN